MAPQARLRTPVHIAVIGAGACSAAGAALAERTGAALAARDAVLVCGGLGGVMGAAAAGARAAGGLTVGLLPGADRRAAHPAMTVVLPTSMGHGRNLLVVAAGEAVVALPGEAGTASEIALARVLDRPVFAVDAWRDAPGVTVCDTPEAAVDAAVRCALNRR